MQILPEASVSKWRASKAELPVSPMISSHSSPFPPLGGLVHCPYVDTYVQDTNDVQQNVNQPPSFH